MKKPLKTKKKRSDAKRKIIQLPSSNLDMENFIDANRNRLLESVVDGLEYAVKNNLGGIEILSFDRSNYIALISRKDYKENLDNILNLALVDENYELCGRVHNIIKLIRAPVLSRKLKLVNLIK